MRAKRLRLRLAGAVLLALGVLLGAPADVWSQAQVTLAPSASPGVAPPGLADAHLIASNFPAGALVPAQINVTLQPRPGFTGPEATVPAGSVVTIVGSARRIGFRVPASLVVEAPTPYSVSVAGTVGGTSFTSSSASALVVNPLARLTAVTSGSGQPGQIVDVTIAGQFTNFFPIVSQVSAGAGIAVSSVSVTGRTTLTARLSIDAAAAPGPRTVTVTTGTEVTSLVGGFVVAQADTTGPRVTASTPTGTVAGPVDRVTLSFTEAIQDGTFTLADVVSLTGPAGAVAASAVNRVTPSQFEVVFPPQSAPGVYTLVIGPDIRDAAGNQMDQNQNAVNGEVPTDQFTGSFTIAAPPSLVGVSPNSAQQGQTLNVVVTGQNTNFEQGQTSVSFGAGITVNSLTVTSPTSATLNIALAVNAVLGGRVVTVTTGAEVVTLANAFTVLGAPAITNVNPNSGQQGQTLNLTVTGQNTSFVQGQTAATFGAGITVNTTTVLAATVAIVNITINPLATPGSRTVTLTTGTEVAALTNGFTVLASTAAISQVTPNTGQPGQTLNVAIAGQNTNFAQGVTGASFGAGITVNVVTVTGPTAATANITIGAGAAAGPRTVTVTTGGEVASLLNGFTVTAGTAAIAQVTPQLGRQAQTLDVSVTGQFTSWLQGQTAATFGTGIVVNSVTVASATSATVNLSIVATASVGARVVTMTTGGEVASLVGGFTVEPGLPTLTSVSPNAGLQGQSLTVILNGQFTAFTSGVTTASFGPGITVGAVTVNGPALASVPITISPNATSGPRTVTVTTGSQVVQLSDGFTVGAGAPAITIIDPNVGVPGALALVVDVAGQSTNFQNGVTVASFGPNISVGGATEGVAGPVVVTSPSTFVASLDINLTAPLGQRTVTVQTGSEALIVVGGFTVATSPDTSNPSVLTVSPANGATDVPLNPEIVVEFNEPIDRTTVTTSSFTLQDNVTSQNVPGAVSVDASGRIATFVPSQLLGVNRNHSIILNSTITDQAGNTLFFFFSTFTTGLATDTTGPSLVDVSPRGNDTGVPLNVDVVLQFDEPIDPLTRAAGLQVQLGGVPVPGNFTFSSGNRIVTFQPVSPLIPSTTYTVVLTADLTDVSGNSLTNPGSRSFTTGAASDTTPPTVTFRTPESNDVVGRNVVVRVEFSERVNPATVTTGTFGLVHQATGQVVAAAVAMGADRLSATLTPATGLLPNTQYFWQLFSYQDLAGNTGGGNFIAFTTSDVEDTAGPVVVAVSPLNGATGVPVNARVVVRLNEALDTTSVTAGVVALTPAVAGTVGLGTDGVTVTMTSAGTLAVATTYTVTVSGLRDVTGNAMAGPFTSSFTTSAAGVADGTNPVVTGVTPGDGATNVAVTTPVVITVSEPITVGAVSGDAVPITVNATGVRVAGTYTVNAAATQITFTPLAPYPASTLMQVAVNNNSTIKDLAGNNLNFVSSTFTTAAVADGTPPVVTSVTPGDGATGVGLNAVVVLTFSESLDPSTVSAATFGLLAGGTALGTSVSRSADNRTVMLQTTLPAATAITVVATSGVEDLSGNALAGFRSTFVTGAAVDATRPSVVTQRPGNGATGVPASTVITLFVNEALAAATVPGAVFVSANGVLVTGTVAVTGGGQAIEFTPSAPFGAGALVQVFVEATARDVAGNAVNAYSGQFTVARDPATQAPTVVRVSPEFGLTGVALNGVMEVEFSEALNPATVVSPNIALYVNQTGALVSATITLREGNRVVRLTPTTALAASTLYVVQVTTGLQDAQGTAVPFTQNPSFFTTGTASDGTAPAVTAVTPPDGTTGVGVNALMQVRFSERINPLTVSGSTVQVVGGGQTVVPASISFNTGDTEVTVTPLEPLPDSTVMTVTVAGVQDLAGNAVTPVTSTFTTGARADTVGPTVVAASVLSGDTEVPVNAVLELEFDEALDPQSVTSTSIQLFDNTTGLQVAATLGLSEGGRTVTLTPSAPLGAGRGHFLQVNNGVRDVAGNAASFYSAFFTTALATDSTGPQVVLVTPGAGLTGVPINARLQVLFDEAVQATSLEQVQVLVGGAPIGVTRALTNGNRTLTLTPTVLLAASTQHTISIAGVRDAAGNAMAAPVTASFTTGPGADFVQPSVTALSPPTGSINVPVTTTASATFSEAMNPLTAVGFVVLQVTATGVVVPTTLAASSDSRTVILTPVAALSPGTQYTIAVTSSSITDLAGNALSNFPTSNFTTVP